MKIHAFRLSPGQDLKAEIQRFVSEKRIKAGAVITCVGSLRFACLRMAGESSPHTFEQKFEIVSLVGTLSATGSHLHISLSDNEGNMLGGHLLGGCQINTTAEIVIAEIDNYSFSREMDDNTGYKELVISPM